ncbi:zinc finger C2HC domain-containing protein 1A [Ictalurus furcatus]|uniref:zinc finger C2HC domain-containing protein 1A n=1 Tax=Ictalurus furcatus TaxID=66913 RepID=UPI0023500876|nr:zinc finger C2HC domain-containing protein 1A [Ictalurus furcatus]
MEELDESVPVGEELLPCKVCKRTFLRSVLKKHTVICQKAAAKKRRAFDSSRQRAEGTDIPTVKPLKPKPEPPKKVSDWRRKHEEFIATIRAAKGLSQVMKDGGPLPPPPPPSYDPDYIQCLYCQRRFSENAAERHIKFCKEQASRITNKGKFPGSDKAKPPAKMQYKTDKTVPVKKASSVSSTSSSVSSSRLPQRSANGQGGGTGISSTTGSMRNVNMSTSFSPSRLNSGGVTSPPCGANTKPKGIVAPSSLKSTTYTAGMNKKKVYSANSYNSRNETKNDNEVDCSTPGTKFCHGCGTKYPVDWAKFCCECGVRRMCI